MNCASLYILTTTEKKSDEKLDYSDGLVAGTERSSIGS
jgi:hypothetical protein